MRPIKSGPLTNLEIEELDAFLLSDDGLENAMDVSSLDGFLCAVLSGPNVIMPSKWIPWVWDSTEGNQLPMFHANGWTFTWINPARGMTHVCLRRVEPKMIYQMIKDERITMLCAAPTVLISIANAPAEMRAGARRGVRLFTAGAPPAAATIELVERELGWELTHVYGLTETSPLITFCEPLPEHQTLSLQERAQIKARQGVELVSSGELKVVDEHGNEVA